MRPAQGNRLAGSSCVLFAVAICAAAPSIAKQDDTGVEFSAVYTADWMRNLSGGRASGTRYLDNLDLTLGVDLPDALGAGRVFAYGLYNNGSNLSGELVGDLQVVSNVEAARAWRLYEFWYELGDEDWSLRTGLYDLNSEFDVKDSAALFINSSHGIGAEFAQAGRNGPGIFPVSALAMRGDIKLGGVTLRGGVMDGVPGDPGDPSSNEIDIGGDDGALMAVEADADLSAGTRVWAGYWRFSKRFDSPYEAGRRDSNAGWYAGVEQSFMLLGRASAGYLRVGEANEALNPIEYFVGAGLRIDAPLPGRSRDQFGVGVAAARTGKPYRDSFDTGRPTDWEIAWELTFRARVSDKLVLQPDLQYVVHPAAGALDDALVAGLRLIVEL